MTSEKTNNKTAQEAVVTEPCAMPGTDVFSVEIDAPRETVWHVLTNASRDWHFFGGKESQLVGDWTEGSEMRFVSSTGLGVVCTVAVNKSGERLHLSHTAMLLEGELVPLIDKYADGREHFDLAEKDGKTKLRLEGKAPEKLRKNFLSAWPRSLRMVKLLAEVITMKRKAKQAQAAAEDKQIRVPTNPNEAWIMIFLAQINAPRSAVWHTLTDPEQFQKWSAPLNEGSRFVGDWSEGSEIRFVNAEGAGLISKVLSNSPCKHLFVRHLGTVSADGEENFADDNEWRNAHDLYEITEDDEGMTALRVEMEVPTAHRDSVMNTWPSALARIVELSETDAGAYSQPQHLIN